MDAVTLDGLLGEIAPRIAGRHLSRPRLASPTALSLEVSGEKGQRLWLDLGRSTAGVYLLDKEAARRLEALSVGEPGGGARQALLHVRKHLDGARVRDFRRVAGTRVVVLDAGNGALVLAILASPSLGVVVDGTVLGTIGDGQASWPLPPSAPERDWDHVSAEEVAAAVRHAEGEGKGMVRAALMVCPALSPALSRTLDGDPATFERLRDGLRQARPLLVAPGSPAAWHDALLAPAGATSLWPLPPPGPSKLTVIECPSWREAAALFLEGRLRGQRFDVVHRRALEACRRELRRLAQLEAHLQRDLAGLPDEAALRHDGEALLAWAEPLPKGALEVDVADPRDPSRTRRVAVDPARGGPQSADLLFAKARRIERARRQVGERLRAARAALALAGQREERLAAARDTEDPAGEVDANARTPARAKGDQGASGPRHYLTSRGLSILVGRGARENHHLTFTVAAPEDVWLHARDVPGAHVILKDPEGRAGPEDLREAAEVAAFCSDAAAEARADVHVTRRKHVRAARGGPGRVSVGHSETLRVAPRDPEGRLRRR